MRKDKRGPSLHDTKQQNAREELPADNGSAAFTVAQGANPLGALDVTIQRIAAAGRAKAAGEDAHINAAWFEGVADTLRLVFGALASQPPQQAEVPMADAPPPSERVGKLLEETPVTGTAPALAQSLKVYAQLRRQDGHHGHVVILERAERFVRVMAMQVTRFLSQPDCRLTHPSLDFDLLAAHVDVADTGQVMVHCTDLDGNGWRVFPLDELVSAGPVNDTMRAMVREVGKSLAQSAIGQMIDRGALPGFDTFQQAERTGGEAYNEQDSEDRADDAVAVPSDSAWQPKEGDRVTYTDGEGRTFEGPVGIKDGSGALEVHALQPHSEYLIEGSGPHAEPVGFDPPEDDAGFGENGS